MLDALIAKLEKRFSPEFSRLLAKRVMNTPKGFGERNIFDDRDLHPLNRFSTHIFTALNSEEHIHQALSELTETKTKG